MQFGCRLWREQFRTVTCLSLNMRTTCPLRDILQEMRRGKLSDASWRALQARVLGKSEATSGLLEDLPNGVRNPRLSQPPFSTSSVAYVVHRHNLRACQSYCNAVRASIDLRTRLYVAVPAVRVPPTRSQAAPSALHLPWTCLPSLHQSPPPGSHVLLDCPSRDVASTSW